MNPLELDTVFLFGAFGNFRQFVGALPAIAQGSRRDIERTFSNELVEPAHAKQRERGIVCGNKHALFEQHGCLARVLEEPAKTLFACVETGLLPFQFGGLGAHRATQEVDPDGKQQREREGSECDETGKTHNRRPRMCMPHPLFTQRLNLGEVDLSHALRDALTQRAVASQNGIVEKAQIQFERVLEGTRNARRFEVVLGARLVQAECFHCPPERGGNKSRRAFVANRRDTFLGQVGCAGTLSAHADGCSHQSRQIANRAQALIRVYA